MRYDVILWDVDGTLLDFSYSEYHSLWNCLEEIGVTPTEEMIKRYSVINDSWWKRLERGEVTKKELLPGRFQDFFTEYNLPLEKTEDFRKQYQESLGTVYQYMEDSLEVCKALKGHCKQFAVTNGVTATQLSKLKLSGFYDVLDNIFISEQIGVPKPQRAFFDRVLETIPEVPKAKVLIVGDSLSSDIRGGNAAEIDTCWYNPNDVLNETEAETTYIIRKLREVIQIAEG